jgi:acyl carrier protein
MNMAMSRDEIQEKVKQVLVDALGVDDDEVTGDAIIKDDLGAESIDFLDISFRLEKAFNIKIGKGEMFDETIASNPTYVQDGKLTAAGIEELKKKMPHTDMSDLEKDPQVARMSRLFTVDAIVNYVEQKLSQPQAA